MCPVIHFLSCRASLRSCFLIVCLSGSYRYIFVCVFLCWLPCSLRCFLSPLCCVLSIGKGIHCHAACSAKTSVCLSFGTKDWGRAPSRYHRAPAHQRAENDPVRDPVRWGAGWCHLCACVRAWYVSPHLMHLPGPRKTSPTWQVPNGVVFSPLVRECSFIA